LQVLQGESAQDGAFALMFKTHPAPAERIDRLDSLMQGRFDGLPANQGKPIKDRLKEFGK
jgi:predicted Zn-dependent protease